MIDIRPMTLEDVVAVATLVNAAGAHLSVEPGGSRDPAQTRNARTSSAGCGGSSS